MLDLEHVAPRELCRTPNKNKSTFGIKCYCNKEITQRVDTHSEYLYRNVLESKARLRVVLSQTERTLVPQWEKPLGFVSVPNISLETRVHRIVCGVIASSNPMRTAINHDLSKKGVALSKQEPLLLFAAERYFRLRTSLAAAISRMLSKGYRLLTVFENLPAV